jgi:hypothetical protein
MRAHALVTAPLVLALSACDPSSSRPETAHNALLAGAQCSFQGATRLAGKVFAQASGEDVVGEASGARIGVWIQTLAPGGQARGRVQLRADAAGPTLKVDGWMDLSDLRLYLRHDVRVVEDHAWVSGGAPVSILGGDRQRVRLQAKPHLDGFDDLSAETTCAALAFASDVTVREQGRASRGTPHHPARGQLVLHDELGKPLRTLQARHPELVTVYVTERRGDLARIVHDDWVRVDGWVLVSDLAPGAGGDCDDCRGAPPDIQDTCFGHPVVVQENEGCVSHGERLVVVKAQTALRGEGRDDAAAVGSVDKGARVYVVNALEKGWVQIAPANGALIAPDRLGFWAKASDVE